MHAPNPPSRPTRRILLTACALLLAMTVTACGSSDTDSSATTTTAETPAKSSFPVTVKSCGREVTFKSAPKRAVSNDVNLTEDMLALGLAPQMVGTFGVGDTIAPDYQDDYDTVKHVSSDYFTLEPLVGLKPDFLFAGWFYGLSDEDNLTPDSLSKYGIETYELEESCAHVQKSKTNVDISNTYTDLDNLGKIFGVTDRSDKLIADMKAKVADVQTKLGDSDAKKVFVYDSGESAPYTAPGLALPNDLIERAGGTNVFADLKKSWTEVSWEKVVAAEPDCVLINDYDTPSAAQKQTFMETSDITNDIPAVKNECFLALTYAQLTPGPRNADAIVAIAEWLHPEAFDS